MDLAEIVTKADDIPEDPFALFTTWFAQAEESEPSDPNAMSVATISSQGIPNVRILLLKAFDENGFVFYTNTNSDKGSDLKANPLCALCFYWKSLNWQVRIGGPITPVTEEEADQYYNSRPRGSRIGAWASKQSQAMDDRQELQERIDSFEEKFSGTEDIPRPPHWSGYRVAPQTMEFWQAGTSRLHTRIRYEKSGEKWDKRLLYP